MTRHIRHCLNMIILAVAVVALLAMVAASAFAQAPCASRDALVKMLHHKYKEGPVNFGTVNGKTLVEVFASEKGTFTIIATQASGLSCIITAGQDWEVLPHANRGESL
jgi:hypothetical protein